jgi:hypothetical protein
MPAMRTGFLPALTALVILGLPPVIINTTRALGSTDRGIIEAALACAMGERRVFWKIRLPLALPFVITGLRISGLQVAAGAILAAYIGAGGLGRADTLRPLPVQDGYPLGRRGDDDGDIPLDRGFFSAPVRVLDKIQEQRGIRISKNNICCQVAASTEKWDTISIL